LPQFDVAATLTLGGWLENTIPVFHRLRYGMLCLSA
jgi:hypothetical protein